MALERTTFDVIPAALVGGGQAGAPQIRPQSMTRITAVATAADSVMLPSALPGSLVFVQNAAAANACAVFPAKGDAINAGAADAVLSVAAAGNVIFFCAVAGKWAAVVSG